jgi:hypothetical protein
MEEEWICTGQPGKRIVPDGQWPEQEEEWICTGQPGKPVVPDGAWPN